MTRAQDARTEAFVRWAASEPVEMVPGLVRRTLACGDRLMVVEFRAGSGVEVPNHSHPHDQAGYVVSGEMDLTIDAETVRCGPGDSYFVAGGALHHGRFVSESVVVDCFSPPRDDYRRQSIA